MLCLPFFFTPGFMGNSLFVTVTQLPPSCPTSILYHRIQLWPNEELQTSNPACLAELLSMQYNVKRHIYDPIDGIDVDAGEFGPLSSLILSQYQTLMKYLQTQLGYVAEKNLFALPYDWRQYDVSLGEHGFFKRVQLLIEKVYEANQQKRVIIIAHSNGPAIMYGFAMNMTLAWRNKYIAGLVGLSGNFAGQLDCIEEFLWDRHTTVIPDRALDRQVQSTWEASYFCSAYPPTVPSRLVLVSTETASPSSTHNYTASEIPRLLSEYGQKEWSFRMQEAFSHPRMNRTAAPMIDLFCLYGTQVSTPWAYSFKGPILQEEYNVVTYGNGDGNQDDLDNRYCRIWKEPLTRAGHLFEAWEFPNVEHTHMSTDENVHARLAAILTHYP
eukprot:TRINITY_DN217_c1_g2_i2.p1 TRINITY_DN217_c1_g2~~TRINITY_DN217_c1_g2_i2.p1  ORF type:complete len:384 (+),score=74.07 TRINITY_DN217_c1_g2_i2:170-1321(+)